MSFRPSFFAALIAATCACFGTQAQTSHGSPPTARSSNAPPNSPDADRTQQSNLYRNPTFGFRYNVILGWVNRTLEMQPGEGRGGKNGAHQGKVLLAVFERPPELQGDAINSAVVIALESAASYPGLKQAADYVAPLTELATGQGLKIDGEPSEVTIDKRTLVQCDFTRSDNKRPAYQSTLILLQKGSIVSFTFIGANKDEVESLISRLTFVGGSAPKSK